MFQRGREKRREDDLDEEICAYVALTEAEKIAGGMTRDEAHRLALAEAGGVEQIKQAVRDSRPGIFWHNLSQDVMFGARQLRRNPGYAAIAVLTLALGLGALATMGSLLWSVLLRPLPFQQQQQLVSIGGWYPKGWVRAVAERTRTLSGVMSYSVADEHNVQSGAGPERVFLSTVTSNAFSVLGVTPILGRAFHPEEATTGRDRVVLISEEYWRDRFAGDHNVLSKSLRIDGEVYSIIGVLPRQINFPTAEARLWIPMSFKPGDAVDPWAMFTGSMIGRMRPGVTPAAVQAELRALHPALLRLFPWRMPDHWYADVAVTTLLSATAGDTRPRILILFAAAVLLLIVACCNVASLMVERASQRSGEFAIRGALGAPAKRLVSQLLTESLLLGTLSAICGISFAQVLLPALRMILPADLPRLTEVQLHWPVLLAVAVVAVCVSVCFGFAPALRFRSKRLQQTMQMAHESHTSDQMHLRVSGWLVIAQMAIAVATICTAGVLLHSLWHLLHVDPGFRTENVLTAQVSMDGAACTGSAGHAHCAQTFRSIQQRIAQQKGVSGAALVSIPPVLGNDDGWAFDADGHPRLSNDSPEQGSTRVISPNYFNVLGIPLLRGRMFEESDTLGQTHALIVSERMADRLWPAADAIGKRVESVGREAQQGVLDANANVIVGIVGNTRHGGVNSQATDEMYLPLVSGVDQSDSFDQAKITVVVRTAQTGTENAEALRRIVAAVEPNAPVSRVTLLRSMVSQSIAAERSLTVLLSTFTVLITALGIVGIYGLTAAIVSSRRKEMSIRMALGAGRGAVARVILRRGLAHAFLGGGIGLLVAAAGIRWLQSVLYATSPLDTVTFALVPVILLAITVVACAVPTWRAAHLNPIEALRNE